MRIWRDDAMDRLRPFSSDEAGFESLNFEAPSFEADATPPPMIGVDERRMHVRAYNFWANLLGTRSFPAIDDLDVHQLGDFGDHSVLLDFTAGIENPAIAFVGDALLAECQLEVDVGYIADVPRGSLLSRLTDHYLQIIANRAPIGFEAEFVNAAGVNILYRGVLLPFSSDDDTIDFILGVINWKEAADPALAAAIAEEVAAAAVTGPVGRSHNVMPLWADGPDRAHAVDSVGEVGWPVDDDAGAACELLLDTVDAENASLADRLAVARECAAHAAQSESRGHKALYEAIGRTWDFACAVRHAEADFAELIEEAGLTVSPRSPMTAVAKLVFGTTYDKTRIAEVVTVLRFAEREAVQPADLPQRIAAHAGGLKGLVKAERAAAKPAQTAMADPFDRATAQLRNAAALGRIIGLPAGEDEFVVLVARRDADGMASVVAQLDPKKSRATIAALNTAK
jgi:hypothetical protein